MTLPKDVAEELASMKREITDPEDHTAYQIISAYVLSRNAEIDRLQSRLAAADALLRDIRAWDVDCALDAQRDVFRPLFILPNALRQRIQDHLRGAGDD